MLHVWHSSVDHITNVINVSMSMFHVCMTSHCSALLSALKVLLSIKFFYNNNSSNNSSLLDILGITVQQRHTIVSHG